MKVGLAKKGDWGRVLGGPQKATGSALPPPPAKAIGSVFLSPPKLIVYPLKGIAKAGMSTVEFMF